MKLSVGEWRLFLLSDCLKYYRDVYQYTEVFRKGGKIAVLQGITKEEANELDNFISDEDVTFIRDNLRKEWKFSGKVVDNGSPDYTCDYCQWQQIRYKFLCVNEVNRTWLSLGSTCVGHIVHGEQDMESQEFAEGVVKDLDRYKRHAKSEEELQAEEAKRIERERLEAEAKQLQEELQAKLEQEKELQLQELRQKRQEQHERIKDYTQFLEDNGKGGDVFFVSLKKQWNSGRLLSEKQESALIRWAFKVRKEIENGVQGGTTV